MNWNNSELKDLKGFIEIVNGIPELKVSTPYLQDGRYKSDPGLFQGLKWLLELYEVVLSPTNMKYPFIVPTKNGMVLVCSEDSSLEYLEDSTINSHVGGPLSASSIIESHDRFYSCRQVGDRQVIGKRIEAYRYQAIKAINHNLDGGSNGTSYPLGIDDELIALAIDKFNASLGGALSKLGIVIASRVTKLSPPPTPADGLLLNLSNKEVETRFSKEYLKTFEGCRVLIVRYSIIKNRDEVVAHCKKLYDDLEKVFSPDSDCFLTGSGNIDKLFKNELTFYMIILEDIDPYSVEDAKKFTDRVKEINYYSVLEML
jgi:hypothetical protein